MSIKQRHLACHNGHIYSFYIVNDRSSTVHCCKESYASETTRLSLKPLIIAHPSVSLICCSSVLSSRVKSQKLFLLLGYVDTMKLVLVEDDTMTPYLDVQLQQPWNGVFHINISLAGNNSSTFVFECNSVNLSVELSSNTPPSHAFIVNGPDIVAVFRNVLFITRFDSIANTHLKFVFILRYARNVSWSPLWLRSNENSLTILLQATGQNRESMPSDLHSTFCSFVLMFSKSDVKIRPVESPIPALYADIINCVHICSLEECNHKEFHAYITTTKSQLLHLEKGKVRACAWLPFQDINKILLLESAAGSAYIGLVSERHSFCLVDHAKFTVSITL